MKFIIKKGAVLVSEMDHEMKAKECCGNKLWIIIDDYVRSVRPIGLIDISYNIPYAVISHLRRV